MTRHSRSIVARHAACLALVALGSVTLTPPALGQAAFPGKPVKLVVGFPPGSTTDVAARIVAQRMGETLGQQVIVDNRAGASSNIAAKAVALSPPDGYTIFMGTIANTINVTLQPANSADIGKEFLPISMVGSVPNLLVVHPSLKVESVAQLIDAARKEPGRITYASSGTGTSPHLSGELFSEKADVKMLHVPYKGSSPAVSDLVAGQVQAMFSPASTVLPFIRSGRLKALASTGLQRTELAPELPTVAESGLPGFETSVWFGFMAPLATPPDIMERLRAATVEAQQNPQVVSQLQAQGIDVVKAGPAEFTTLIAAETAKWAQVIKAGDIKAE